jgi:hypothetical protein
MPISERDQFTKKIEHEATINPIISRKHDPNCTDQFSVSFRTILTHAASGSILNIIGSRAYDVFEYQDTRYNNLTNVLVPKDWLTAPQLGFVSGSCNHPSSDFRCLTVTSGSVQGVHPYAECPQTIHQNKLSGRWINERLLSEEPPGHDN